MIDLIRTTKVAITPDIKPRLAWTDRDKERLSMKGWANYNSESINAGDYNKVIDYLNSKGFDSNNIVNTIVSMPLDDLKEANMIRLRISKERCRNANRKGV